MRLTAQNFTTFAASHYDNPACVDDDEFRQDLARFKQLKRAFNQYETSGTLNIRWVVNQIIILYNIFESSACTAMILTKFPESLSILKPILLYLNRWPETENDVVLDTKVVTLLRELDATGTS